MWKLVQKKLILCGVFLLIHTPFVNNLKCSTQFTFFFWPPHIAYVLWQYEGYTVMYSQNPRKITRAEPKRFSEGSDYILPHIPTLAFIKTLSNLRNNAAFLVGQYWKRWFSVLLWQIGLYFAVFDQLSWANIKKYIPRDFCLFIAILLNFLIWTQICVKVY